jgi:hypothetical protein
MLDASILESTGLSTETIAMTPGEGRYPLDFLNPIENRGQLVLMPPPLQQLPVDTSPAGLMSAFYVFFFPAHPFLLPRGPMLEMLEKTRNIHLEMAIQYIGSFYVPVAPTEAYQASLHQMLTQSNFPKDGTLVQSLLLLAIGLHIADKRDDSATIMYSALNMAVELGMNHRSFATNNGSPGTVLEESWRRTWWELYVVDGMFAGVNPDYSQQLQLITTNIPLPGEEADYANGVSSTLASR